MDAVNGPAVARNAAAIFAATLLLASCGSPNTESAGEATSAPSSKAADTAIPSVDAKEPSDGGGASDTASEGPDDGSETESESAPNGSTDPSESSSSAPSAPSKAVKGPSVVAHWRADDIAQILNRPNGSIAFPIQKADLEKIVAQSVGEGSPDTAVTCDADSLADVGADPVQCTYTDAEGNEATAYVHATKSVSDDVGVLVFPRGDGLSNEALAKAYLEPGVEVFAHGSGSMWGVDAPVPAEDIADQVKASMEAQDREDIESVTCDSSGSITDGKNQVNCTITLDDGQKATAVTLLAHLPTSQDNGTVSFVKFPSN